MPRFEIPHSNRAGRTTGDAGFALLAALVPSVLLVGCGFEYGSAEPSGNCRSQIHAVPATLRMEVGRAAWVQVRDGPAPAPPGLSQMCANVAFEATPKVRLLYWRSGEVLIAGVSAGQTAVELLI